MANQFTGDGAIPEPHLTRSVSPSSIDTVDVGPGPGISCAGASKENHIEEWGPIDDSSFVLHLSDDGSEPEEDDPPLQSHQQDSPTNSQLSLSKDPLSHVKSFSKSADNLCRSESKAGLKIPVLDVTGKEKKDGTGFDFGKCLVYPILLRRVVGAKTSSALSPPEQTASKTSVQIPKHSGNTKIPSNSEKCIPRIIKRNSKLDKIIPSQSGNCFSSESKQSLQIVGHKYPSPVLSNGKVIDIKSLLGSSFRPVVLKPARHVACQTMPDVEYPPLVEENYTTYTNRGSETDISSSDGAVPEFSHELTIETSNGIIGDTFDKEEKGDTLEKRPEVKSSESNSLNGGKDPESANQNNVVDDPLAYNDSKSKVSDSSSSGETSSRNLPVQDCFHDTFERSLSSNVQNERRTQDQRNRVLDPSNSGVVNTSSSDNSNPGSIEKRLDTESIDEKPILEFRKELTISETKSGKADDRLLEKKSKDELVKKSPFSDSVSETADPESKSPFLESEGNGTDHDVNPCSSDGARSFESSEKIPGTGVVSDKADFASKIENPDQGSENRKTDHYPLEQSLNHTPPFGTLNLESITKAEISADVNKKPDPESIIGNPVLESKSNGADPASKIENPAQGLENHKADHNLLEQSLNHTPPFGTLNLESITKAEISADVNEKPDPESKVENPILESEADLNLSADNLETAKKSFEPELKDKGPVSECKTNYLGYDSNQRHHHKTFDRSPDPNTIENGPEPVFVKKDANLEKDCSMLSKEEKKFALNRQKVKVPEHIKERLRRLGRNPSDSIDAQKDDTAVLPKEQLPLLESEKQENHGNPVASTPSVLQGPFVWYPYVPLMNVQTAMQAYGAPGNKETPPADVTLGLVVNLGDRDPSNGNPALVDIGNAANDPNSLLFRNNLNEALGKNAKNQHSIGCQADLTDDSAPEYEQVFNGGSLVKIPTANEACKADKQTAFGIMQAIQDSEGQANSVSDQPALTFFPKLSDISQALQRTTIGTGTEYQKGKIVEQPTLKSVPDSGGNNQADNVSTSGNQRDSTKVPVTLNMTSSQTGRQTKAALGFRVISRKVLEARDCEQSVTETRELVQNCPTVLSNASETRQCGEFQSDQKCVPAPGDQKDLANESKTKPGLDGANVILSETKPTLDLVDEKHVDCQLEKSNESSLGSLVEVQNNVPDGKIVTQDSQEKLELEKQKPVLSTGVACQNKTDIGKLKANQPLMHSETDARCKVDASTEGILENQRESQSSDKCKVDKAGKESSNNENATSKPSKPQYTKAGRTERSGLVSLGYQIISRELIENQSCKGAPGGNSREVGSNKSAILSKVPKGCIAGEKTSKKKSDIQVFTGDILDAQHIKSGQLDVTSNLAQPAQTVSSNRLSMLSLKSGSSVKSDTILPSLQVTSKAVFKKRRSKRLMRINARRARSVSKLQKLAEGPVSTSGLLLPNNQSLSEIVARKELSKRFLINEASVLEPKASLQSLSGNLSNQSLIFLSCDKKAIDNCSEGSTPFMLQPFVVVPVEQLNSLAQAILPGLGNVSETQGNIEKTQNTARTVEGSLFKEIPTESCPPKTPIPVEKARLPEELGPAGKKHLEEKFSNESNKNVSGALESIALIKQLTNTSGGWAPNTQRILVKIVDLLQGYAKINDDCQAVGKRVIDRKLSDDQCSSEGNPGRPVDIVVQLPKSCDKQEGSSAKVNNTMPRRLGNHSQGIATESKKVEASKTSLSHAESLPSQKKDPACKGGSGDEAGSANQAVLIKLPGAISHKRDSLGHDDVKGVDDKLPVQGKAHNAPESGKDAARKSSETGADNNCTLLDAQGSCRNTDGSNSDPVPSKVVEPTKLETHMNDPGRKETVPNVVPLPESENRNESNEADCLQSGCQSDLKHPGKSPEDHKDIESGGLAKDNQTISMSLASEVADQLLTPVQDGSENNVMDLSLLVSKNVDFKGVRFTSSGGQELGEVLGKLSSLFQGKSSLTLTQGGIGSSVLAGENSGFSPSELSSEVDKKAIENRSTNLNDCNLLQTNTQNEVTTVPKGSHDPQKAVKYQKSSENFVRVVRRLRRKRTQSDSDEGLIYRKVATKSIVSNNLIYGCSPLLVSSTASLGGCPTFMSQPKCKRKRSCQQTAETVNSGKSNRKHPSRISNLVWKNIRYNGKLIGRKRTLLEPCSALFAWECPHMFTSRKLFHDRHAIADKLQKHEIQMTRIINHYRKERNHNALDQEMDNYLATTTPISSAKARSKISNKGKTLRSHKTIATTTTLRGLAATKACAATANPDVTATHTDFAAAKTSMAAVKMDASAILLQKARRLSKDFYLKQHTKFNNGQKDPDSILLGKKKPPGDSTNREIGRKDRSDSSDADGNSKQIQDSLSPKSTTELRLEEATDTEQHTLMEQDSPSFKRKRKYFDGTNSCECSKIIDTIDGNVFQNSITKLARSVSKHVRKRKKSHMMGKRCAKCGTVLESAKELTRHLLYHLVDKAVDDNFGGKSAKRIKLKHIQVREPESKLYEASQSQLQVQEIAETPLIGGRSESRRSFENTQEATITRPDGMDEEEAQGREPGAKSDVCRSSEPEAADGNNNNNARKSVWVGDSEAKESERPNENIAEINVDDSIPHWQNTNNNEPNISIGESLSSDNPQSKENVIYKAQFWKMQEIPWKEEEGSDGTNANGVGESPQRNRVVWTPLYFGAPVRPVTWQCMGCRKKFKGISDLKIHGDSCLRKEKILKDDSFIWEG